MSLDNTERERLAEVAIMAVMEAPDPTGKVRALTFGQVRELMFIAFEVAAKLERDAEHRAQNRGGTVRL